MNAAVIVYDDECNFCQGSVNWIKKRALPYQFVFIPCNSPDREQLFPKVTKNACENAIQLISGGKLYSGAEAIPEILANLKGWRWLEMLLRTTLFKFMAPFVYRWIAKNRHFISCVFR